MPLFLKCCLIYQGLYAKQICFSLASLPYRVNKYIKMLQLQYLCQILLNALRFENNG